MAGDSFWESDDVMSEEEADQAVEQIANGEEQVEEEYQEQQQGQYNQTQLAEEEEDDEEFNLLVLRDASLRLEQGNLYKMLLKHDLFEGVDADPRAISNVQRELRAFIRERLEVLVGLKPDPKLVPKVVQPQLPFTDLEIQLLKEFLSKVTGKTEQPKPAALRPSPVQQPAQAKIKPVLGNSNVKVSAPKKAQSQSQPAKPKPKVSEEPKLTKAPSEMTPQELIEYNKIVTARQQGKKAIAIKRMPMPDAQQLENLYATRVQTNEGGNLISAILTKMGKGPPSLIENVGGAYDDSNDGRL
jgi:hypothetical protein